MYIARNETHEPPSTTTEHQIPLIADKAQLDRRIGKAQGTAVANNMHLPRAAEWEKWGILDRVELVKKYLFEIYVPEEAEENNSGG